MPWAVVSEVGEGSPAEAAGLQTGDRLVVFGSVVGEVHLMARLRVLFGLDTFVAPLCQVSFFKPTTSSHGAGRVDAIAGDGAPKQRWHGGTHRGGTLGRRRCDRTTVANTAQSAPAVVERPGRPGLQGGTNLKRVQLRG